MRVRRTKSFLSLLLPALAITMSMQMLSSLAEGSAPRVSEYTLGNGMQVVVVPDLRAPVVTHMVWYRVGAADEVRGVSGIAHFLEHLMFKSTDKLPSGEFSKIVARLGGNDNAFTGHDATAYFQRIAKDRLPTVMAMEADRMVNLKLTEKEVSTERDVIMEERRSRTDNNPSALLDEQMSATLYQNHHYGVPVIGWMHEMAKLSRADAMEFYKRYYGPNNAILVVTGDVVPEEVKALAEKTYGRLPPSAEIKPRIRASEPEARAARRVELRDARAGRMSLSRYYLAPSYQTGRDNEAAALDLLMKVVGGGSTSRLYQKLVVEQKIASSAGGYSAGSGLDSGKIAVSAVAADGVGLDKVEAAIDAVLAEIMANGVNAAELERAKKSYIAEHIYESDNQATLARRYGWGKVVGRTIAEIDGWPDDVAKVTADQIKAVANAHLDIRRSVTGTLLPIAAEPAPAAAKPAAPTRS